LELNEESCANLGNDDEWKTDGSRHRNAYIYFDDHHEHLVGDFTKTFKDLGFPVCYRRVTNIEDDLDNGYITGNLMTKNRNRV
jgi:hypothetical protein